MAIFFGDLKKEAQKRNIAIELEELLEIDSIEVKSVTVDKDCYGYDPDVAKQRLLERIHVETDEGNWLMIWDCLECKFEDTTSE